MKLLFITQVVDKEDAVLGFVHGWLIELACIFDHIHVICLEKGSVELPANITLHSLGKEEGVSRLEYLKRFYSLVFKLRPEYDGVFVHMNSEYVILAGPLWRPQSPSQPASQTNQIRPFSLPAFVARWGLR